jgi:dihydroorotate dehydrogenase
MRPAHVLYELARPLLFCLDAERAHELTLANLDRAHAAGLTRLLAPAFPDDPVEVMGLRFPNPVGLAAGLDKNGAHIDGLGGLGFGFVEVGTVTPRAQPGNPRPRLFRLPAAHALINRFGFNNLGVDAFVANVQRAEFGGVLGLNIGKNAATPIDRALDDYLVCLRAVYPYAGYVTVNISSPNTKDLRQLQSAKALSELLQGLAEERNRQADRHARYVPIAIKIAPDLDDAELPRVADEIVARGLDAIIATNTTIARDAVKGLKHADEAGGLSGAPLLARSTEVVRLLAQHLRGALPIIGVGGIQSGDDAVAKLRAGAALVQLYTGLIYRGPALVAECRRALRDFRRARPQAAGADPLLAEAGRPAD